MSAVVEGGPGSMTDLLFAPGASFASAEDLLLACEVRPSVCVQTAGGCASSTALNCTQLHSSTSRRGVVPSLRARDEDSKPSPPQEAASATAWRNPLFPRASERHESPSRLSAAFSLARARARARERAADPALTRRDLRDGVRSDAIGLMVFPADPLPSADEERKFARLKALHESLPRLGVPLGATLPDGTAPTADHYDAMSGPREIFSRATPAERDAARRALRARGFDLSRPHDGGGDGGGAWTVTSERDQGKGVVEFRVRSRSRRSLLPSAVKAARSSCAAPSILASISLSQVRLRGRVPADGARVRAAPLDPVRAVRRGRAAALPVSMSPRGNERRAADCTFSCKQCLIRWWI
jgi:hypothetical protein